MASAERRPAPAPTQGVPACSLPELVENTASLHGLTGRSPVMRQLILQMQRVAPHLAVATLEGEAGTGSTLAARALHAAGPAREGPFIPCLAAHFFAERIPTPEAREGGAWSAAILGQARGGMLFLDRVHQLSAGQQETLVNFLHWFDDQRCHSQQSGLAASPRPADRERPLPAQIVFSTSAPLRSAELGFRDQLVSRLSAVRFRLPPLAERREDIPLLAQIFIQRFARAYSKAVRGLGPGTIGPLLRYGWPGNVRELEETITAAALETESQWIRPIDLPPLPAGHRHSLPATGAATAAGESELNLDTAIRGHVTRVLHRTGGNKLRAAQLLGISRSTLYRILAARNSPLGL